MQITACDNRIEPRNWSCDLINSTATSSVDDREVAKFEAMAQEWWDPGGKFRPLHKMNPVRIDYILSQIEYEFGRDMNEQSSLSGIDLLDMGCGGGLLSEPMARLGANVLGTDVSIRNIGIAETHAGHSMLEIEYEVATAEQLSTQGRNFDVVLCMEVIEHVNDPASFMASCATLVRPGGMLICSTLNRNARSFFLAILGAEYVMRWLPVGTHDWNRFIKPEELQGYATDSGLQFVDNKGFVYNPLRDEWEISSKDLFVNYVTTFVQPEKE